MGVYKPTILWWELSCVHTDLLEGTLFHGRTLPSLRSEDIYVVMKALYFYVYTYVSHFGIQEVIASPGYSSDHPHEISKR